jgi:hypothetical protein
MGSLIFFIRLVSYDMVVYMMNDMKQDIDSDNMDDDDDDVDVV